MCIPGAISRLLLLVLVFYLLICSSVSSQPTDIGDEELHPDTLYIVPFLNVMVPAAFSSQMFDSFIDRMLLLANPFDMKIRILKQGVDAIDADWLARQHYVTGELFGFFEESGCCSTEIEAKARVYYHIPGSVDPAGSILATDGIFFDHALSILERERGLLANRLGQALAERLMGDLVIEP